jgi:Protein of unknown function (DUF3567)
MLMVYNSDNYAVVQFDVADDARAAPGPTRGGFEIVDKFARKEIYIDGLMAASFKEGVEALIATSPSEEELDEYLARYVALMQQPLVLH